jgi:hypothetical protein
MLGPSALHQQASQISDLRCWDPQFLTAASLTVLGPRVSEILALKVWHLSGTLPPPGPTVSSSALRSPCSLCWHGFLFFLPWPLLELFNCPLIATATNEVVPAVTFAAAAFTTTNTVLLFSFPEVFSS